MHPPPLNNNNNNWFLYSAFLVWDTTQSALQCIITPVTGFNINPALIVHLLNSLGSTLARCYFRGAHMPHHATNNVRILPGTHLYTWVESSNVDKVSCWRTKSARHWRESNPEPFDPESRVQSNIPRHLPSFVFVFHRLLPKSRVVYCSATGVTDVKNMVSNPQATLHILYFWIHFIRCLAQQRECTHRFARNSMFCQAYVRILLSLDTYFKLSPIYHSYILFVRNLYHARFSLQVYPAILITMLIGFLNHGSFMVHIHLPGTSKAFHCQFSCWAYALTSFCRAHKDM